MSEEKINDHLNTLKNERGPTIVGKILENSDSKVSILTKFGIYDVSRSDVLENLPSDEGNAKVTICRGAKLLFSQLIDAESLLPRSKASLAHVAQGAKQLQYAINRALGRTELPVRAASYQTADCPMSDCTDCCQCPVIEDSGEAPSRSEVRMAYYEKQIDRENDTDYRKTD